MSNARFSIIQSRAVSDKNISNSQFRTLTALGVFGDKDGWCFPKLKTLSEMLGKSRQAISMDIKCLVEHGYIQVVPQFRPDGSQQNNLYRLIFDHPPLSLPEPPLSSEVEGGLSSEVDALTPHINAPSNDLLKNGSNNDFQILAKAYESNIGLLTSGIADILQDDLTEYGVEMCVNAIRESLRNNIRKWSYVQGILSRWKADGMSASRKNKSDSKKEASKRGKEGGFYFA